MKRPTIILVIVIAVLVVAVAAVGYFYFTKTNGFNNLGPNNSSGPRRGLQLNQSQIDEINNFFNSNPSSADIQTYCKENMRNCFYYCRTINPNADFCKQLAPQRPGNYSRGNYSGYNGGTPQ